MSKREVDHNISLTFDFVRELIKSPDLVEKLPDDFELAFIEKDVTQTSLENSEHKQLVKVKHTFELIAHK